MSVTRRRKVDSVDPMAIVTRFIDAANHHDVDALRACIHREFESFQPIHPARNFRGPGQLISNWKAIFEAEPGFRLSVRRASVTDNTVWVEVHGAGASAEAAGIFIVGIEDGRIRWIRVYSDLVEPLPEPPEPEPEPTPEPAVEEAVAVLAGDGTENGADAALAEHDEAPHIRLVGPDDGAAEAGAEETGAEEAGAEATGADAGAQPEPPASDEAGGSDAEWARSLTLVAPTVPSGETSEAGEGGEADDAGEDSHSDDQVTDATGIGDVDTSGPLRAEADADADAKAGGEELVAEPASAETSIWAPLPGEEDAPPAEPLSEGHDVSLFEAPPDDPTDDPTAGSTDEPTAGEARAGSDEPESTPETDASTERPAEKHSWRPWRRGRDD